VLAAIGEALRNVGSKEAGARACSPPQVCLAEMFVEHTSHLLFVWDKTHEAAFIIREVDVVLVL
jgi:hypothetical protein